MTARIAVLRGEGMALAALGLFGAVLFLWPLWRLARAGLAWGPLGQALADGAVRRALWHSVVTAGVSGALALGIGAALAFLIALGNLRGRGIFVFLLILPMMIPQHVTAIAWIQALGPGSPVLGAFGLAPAPGTDNPLYSAGGIIALLSLHHAPLVLLVMLSALRRLPRGLIDAARISGAGPGRAVARVVLPAVAPALVASYALAVVSTLGNFGIPALLGIPARYITLPVLIWQRLSGFGPSMLGDVAVLSALLGAVAIVAVLAQMALQRRLGAGLSARAQPLIPLELGRFRLPAELLLALYILLSVALPLAALIATSLVPTYGVGLSLKTLTLTNYAEVLLHQQATLRAFANSTLAAGGVALLLATVAVPLAVWLCARGAGRAIAGAVATLGEITYALPGTVISIAFILIFLRPLPLLHLSLYNSLAIILLAYLTAFLSVALKPVAAAAGQIDASLDAAGRVAGAGFGQRLWRLSWPLLAPAAGSGAILVFLTAYNEVTVSSLLWSTGNETIGTTIFNYEDGGYATLAAALSVVTVAVTLALMAGLSLIGRRGPEGVVPWRL